MASKTTILIVDRDEDIVLSIKEGLGSYDNSYALDFAKDAVECLNYIEQKKPDVILLNINLPDMDGFTLRQKLKMTDAKDVPVIFLVDGYDTDMTKKVGMLEADDFIAKPINIPELILRIQKVMVWRCYGRQKKQPRT